METGINLDDCYTPYFVVPSGSSKMLLKRPLKSDAPQDVLHPVENIWIRGHADDSSDLIWTMELLCIRVSIHVEFKIHMLHISTSECACIQGDF